MTSDSEGVAGGGSGTLTDRYHLPCTVSWDFSLSEDHFLLEPANFNPATDSVAAYVHDDSGTLEAMIIQGGVLSQLYHDASNKNAWALAPVPGPGGSQDITDAVQVVAGRPLDADNKVGALHVFCLTKTTVLHLVQESDRSWTATDLRWPAGSGLSPLRISEDPDGGVFVYWFARSAATMDADLHCCRVRRGVSNEITQSGVTGPVAPFIDQTNAVARLSRSAGKLQLWVFTVTGAIAYVHLADLDENLNSTHLTKIEPANPKANLTQPVGWGAKFQGVFAMDETKPPYAIAEGRNGQLWTLVYDPETTQPTKPWRWTAIWNGPKNFFQDRTVAGIRALPQSESSDPSARADKVLDLYALLGTSLWVLRQQPTGSAAADSANPLFSPAVALQGGVAAVSLPRTRGSGTGMMFINSSGELQMLVQDPVSGTWTDSPVHLPATEPVQMTAFRTRLTLTDDWGQPVAGVKVQLTSAAPTLAMVNEQPATLHPSTPLTVSTNHAGQVTVATPATGLAAPALTVAGGPLSAPITKYPSRPVNDYLTGTTPLNTLPPLTADVLSKAPIAATNLQNPDNAVNVITNAAKAAIPAAERVGAQRSLLATQTGPPVLDQQRILTVRGIDWNIGDFVHEVAQAVKTGAATVSAAVKSAESTVANWMVDITVNCGDFINHVVTVTIKDLDSAADVIHSVVAWVGAKIESFIDWLKAQILSVLKDAIAVANTFNGYALNLCTFAQRQVARGKGKTNTWFTNQQTNIANAFDILASQVGNTTLTGLQHQAAVAATGGTGPRDTTATTAPADLSSAANGAHGQWLLDKLRALAPGIAGPVPVPDNLAAKFDDVKAKLGTAGSHLETSAEGIAEDILGGIRNPKDLLGVALPDLIRKIGGLVGGLTEVAQAIVDAVLDLLDVLFDLWRTVLNAKMGELPLIGSLIASVDSSLAQMTVGQFGMLAAAFPFVIAWKIKHGATATVPFTSPSATPRALTGPQHPWAGLEAVPAGDAWNILAGIVTIILGANDSLAASISGVPTTYGKASSPPEFCAVFDVAWPALLTVCAYPNVNDRGVFGNPVDVHDDASAMEFANWIVSVIPALIGTFTIAMDKSDHILKPAAGQLANIAFTIYGGCAIVLGAVRCHLSNETDGKIWALQFTGNLGAISYFLLTPPFRDSPVWGELAALACCIILLASGLVSGILLLVAEPY